MNIQYHIKTVYGVDKCYVSDPEQARQISRLTGRKTIEERDMEALAALGLTVQHVPQK